MTKQTWKPGTMLSPLPPALISSGDMEHPNVMTAAWTGIICSDPVITYVSLRPSRYTHELVSQNKEFVVNLPTWKIAPAVDTVGVKSGRDLDKFALTGLTAEPSTMLKAPQIKECPLSMECKVLEVRSFGTHDMFLAEVVAVNVDEQYIDEKGALDLERAGLLCYAHGFYYTLGRKIGKFGFSVEAKKKQSAQLAVKADKKFAPKVRTIEETEVRHGVEVVTRRSKFRKPERSQETREPKAKGREMRHVGKPSNKKFAEKRTAKTSYEGKPYKKRPDGSFKRRER